MTHSYTFKTEPFKHQLEALSQSATKKNFAYFMEMGCVDGDTEFLTHRGWMNFEDFDLKKYPQPLLIAQAIPGNMSLENWAVQFTEPISYIQKEADEWITLQHRMGEGTIGSLNVKGPSSVFQLMVTKDHELPIVYSHDVRNHRRQHMRTQDDPMLDVTADYIAKVYENDKSRTPYIANDNAKNYLPIMCKDGLLPSDSSYFKADEELNALNEWELRFMVAVMADGTYPNKNNNKVDFYFKKERKIERLKRIAAGAGIPLIIEKKRTRPTRSTSNIIYVAHAIAPLRYKIYTEEWYTLPYDKLKVIADEVFHWDGYIGPKDCDFYSMSKDSADFIQFALFVSGITASLHFDGDKKLYKVKANYKDFKSTDVIPQNEYTPSKRENNCSISGADMN